MDPNYKRDKPGKSPMGMDLIPVYADGEGSSDSGPGTIRIAPEVVNNLGADILRLWVASTDYTGEMTVSDEILKRTADAYRRIRNTVRFLLANLNGFDPATDKLDNSELLSLDRWAIARSLELQNEIIDRTEHGVTH